MKNLCVLVLITSYALIYRGGVGVGLFVLADDNDEDSNKIEEPPTDGATDPEEFKVMYQKMLIKKRQMHHDAIKRILDMKDATKEKEMVSMVLKKLFETMVTSLEKLAKMQQDSGKKGLPLDETTTNDISTIIENTGFTADIALHFPKLFHKLYDKNNDWQLILQSSIGLALSSGLPDSETAKAINLMSQELGIIDKEPDFVNPYKNKRKGKREEEVPVDETPKKKERKKKPRGPGLSGSKIEL